MCQKLTESYTQGHLEQTLYKHWARYVPLVYSGLLDVDVANEEKKAKMFLFRPLETFICDGDPHEIFQQLKQYDNPPALCGRVFRLGEPTYSCRYVVSSVPVVGKIQEGT